MKENKDIDPGAIAANSSRGTDAGAPSPIIANHPHRLRIYCADTLVLGGRAL